MNLDLEKLTDDNFIVGIISLLLWITPGFLLIFFYNPILFSDLETIKLIILSVSYTTPLLLILLSLHIAGNIKTFFGGLLISVTIMNFSFVILLGIKNFFSEKFPEINDFIFYLYFLSFILSIIYYFVTHKWKLVS